MNNVLDVHVSEGRIVIGEKLKELPLGQSKFGISFT